MKIPECENGCVQVPAAKPSIPSIVETFETAVIMKITIGMNTSKPNFDNHQCGLRFEHNQFVIFCKQELLL
jgi:hypothetical protein